MPRLSRRELLRTLGLAAASLPMLDALGNKAWADGAPPRRLVSIVLEHGVFAQHWLPLVPSTLPISTQSPGSLLKAPSTFLRPVPFTQRSGCTAIDLSGYTGALSPVFSQKWQALKSKTAFINNLGCSNHLVQGHTSTAMLGGYKAPDDPGDQYGGFVGLIGESIDVVIGRKLDGKLPLTLKAPDRLDDVRFLQSADRRGGQASFIKNAAGKYEVLPFLTDPLKTWDQLFADYQPPMPGVPRRDPNQRRLALLERSLQNTEAVKRDQRLSAIDRQRLDAHAALLEGQRANLASMTLAPPAPTAMPPARPAGDPTVSVDVFNEAKGRLYRAQFMNAAAALKMNKAQVITLDAGLENEWVTEGISLGGSQAYHGNAGHLANPSLAIIEACRQTQQFVFDTIADFLTELDVVEDPATGATYLDNTLVLITTEHDGRPNGHLRGAVSSLLVGGFGTFKGGFSYDFSRPQLQTAEPSCIYTGFSYSRLLYSVLAAFGVTLPEQSTLAIQGEAQSWQGADLTDWQQPLPGLT